ncbi:DASH family cryptochrome [Leptolyngbya sp. PCC 6406]|uniref:DASH family cryptochrome n=1 Tax=Leptolyngbya sp. PCC 6406 TaxID=1173264 RepID=UPI0002AC208E|nr:DASH family cryptochrome [Leptolyngbya sp. PCC 6406]
MRILLWLRNDLRLHDHAPLQAALKTGAQVIPVYCLDPRQFGQTDFGFPKTGAFRAQFLLEALADLRQSLRRLGGDLVVRQGFPEQVLPALAREVKCDRVYWHREVTPEETTVESALTRTLATQGVAVQHFWGATLYHPDDLPFPLEQLPDIFTQFRKRVERDSRVSTPSPPPTQLLPLPQGLEPGSLSSLQNLGLQPPIRDDRATLVFTGGETAGLARLHHYFWAADCLKTYKETRNGLLGADYSSKFSPWLALGCLSPRYIHSAVQDYETQRVKNDSTYWLVFELLWRDYFRFVCTRYRDSVFYPSGIQGISVPWRQDWPRFEAWCQGMTGYPFVDANMRELAATGFMSNRGRQNVASSLTKNLGIDWRMGAEWFESLLIDYDVCSNWGNWNYTAGVGNDARGFRYFNIPKQAQDYDPQGRYVKHWIPALAQVPAAQVHLPGKLRPEEQRRFQIQLGVDYPRPLVDLQQSVRANEALYNQALAQPRADTHCPR